MRRWSLSDLALDRPVSTIMVLTALFVLGMIATIKLPLAFMPAKEAQSVQVRLDITRTSPEVLEREVIRPMEDAVAGIRDLKEMRTSSGGWGVRLRLSFLPGTDIDARKIELRDRIDRARGDLPEFVQRISLSSSRGMADEAITTVRISSSRDLAEDYYLIEKSIVRPLERIEGVSRVELSGVEPHELEIAVDLQSAKEGGVELSGIGQTVRGARSGRSLGALRGGVEDAGVRAPAIEGDTEAYEALPLRRRSDAPALSDPALNSDGAGPALRARLGEVATVTLHPTEQRRGSHLNGRRAINLDIFGGADASAVEVSQRVAEAIEQIRQDPRLGDIDVIVFHDQGEMILETLGDLRNTGIFGGLIGVFVLFAFLHRFRTTLVAASCIPLSVLAACAVIYVRGEALNTVVLLGLVLGVGMLIDNAVVIVESIQLRLQRGDDPKTAAREGARAVGLATVASTMSSVIVFLPLVLGDPSSEDMYTYLVPLGTTFVSALLASLLVSQTLVPLLTRRIFKAAPKETKHPFLEKLGASYARLIAFTLNRPKLTVFLGLLICGSAYFPATQLNFDFDPQEKSLSLPIQLEFSGSTSFELVESRIKGLEDALLPRKEELGIESIACQFRDYRGNCDIYPAVEIESEAEMSAFHQQIAQALPEQPGVRYRINERDGWRHRNRDARVVGFALRGEDLAKLIELSEVLSARLRDRLLRGDPTKPEAGGYDRITGPFNEGSRELHLKLDSDRLRQYGLDANSVASFVSLAFSGVPLGELRGPEGQVSLRMTSAGGQNPTRADLEDLRVSLPAGGEVPLTSLGELVIERSPWWVQRVNRQTEVRLSVRFFAADPANKELVMSAIEGVHLPDGYSAGERTRWWGQGEDSMELFINIGLSLILVYAVMASLFESVLHPLGILVTCLMGCVGAPWMMWVTGTTVDVVATIGLLILIGIVVNNGIMLVDLVTQLRQHGLSRRDALIQAGRDRLRPILMTASTTILGLLPMLIHHPTLAGVYYHGIAIIVAGGLLTSTLMTLLFLPAAYSLLEDLSDSVRWYWRAGQGPAR